jgi:hypothetical protein
MCPLHHRPQLRQRHEPLQQIARGHRAHVADAQAEQQPRGVGLALGLDRHQQVIDRLVLPALAPNDLVAALAQAIDVGRAFQPAEREELRDRLLAQPLDIQRGAADEVPEPFGALRRADQPPVQRTSTSPSSATASEPHSGQ